MKNIEASKKFKGLGETGAFPRGKYRF